jgi:hypothetical protein
MTETEFYILGGDFVFLLVMGGMLAVILLLQLSVQSRKKDTEKLAHIMYEVLGDDAEKITKELHRESILTEWERRMLEVSCIVERIKKKEGKE